MTTTQVKINKLIQSDGFQPLLTTYLDNNEDIEQRYSAFKTQLSANRFVVPVAGVQGSGKSTTLNAIAFNRRVLPVDVDETTCVPVEIGDLSQAGGMATVHYADGRQEIIQATEEGLSAAVHNAENPGNERGVDRVVLGSDAAVFSNGLVLVDLPGTGSLTPANAATTERYLTEAVGVIFMLRTVPPLTRSESIFIALQWSRLRTAYFLQNRWNDETDEEAQAGRDHNVAVLKQLAERSGIPLTVDPEIYIVNADAALNARFSGDAHALQASGMSAFLSAMEQEGQEWGRRVLATITQAINADLERARAKIEDQLEILQGDSATRQARLAEDSQRFDKYIAAIDTKFTTIRAVCGQFDDTMRQDLEAWGTRMRGELRNTMRTKLRAGITDGPRLKRALEDEQGVAAEDAFEMVQIAIGQFSAEIEGTLGDIEAWTGVVPAERRTVDREESAKWENVLPVAVSSIASILAAVKIGAVVGGSSAGAPTAGILTVPGAIAGAIGGLLVGLVSTWLGTRSRNLITEVRATNAETQVFSAIDDFIDITRKSLETSATDFRKQVDVQLAAWRDMQVKRFEEQRQALILTEQLSQGDRDKQLAQVRLDRDRLVTFANLFQEAANG